MKFWKNIIAFAVTFFATYLLITYLMDKNISDKQFYDTICYTVGATIGYGLITYFQEKKKNKNK